MRREWFPLAVGVALSIAGVAAGLPDWAASSAREASDWQALEGIGTGRANQLVAFFACPEVRALAAQLRVAGVQGF